MANIEITNNKTRGIVIWDPVHEDAIATFGGAATWPAGSVLGKVTATGKYVRFAPGAADGSEVPLAVLSQDVEAGAAGDVPIRPVIAGRVRAGDLVNNVDAALTGPQLDQLRDYSIIALGTTQLAELDNQ
jgi:hypothetical protein